jgi:pyrroline-5-carboxylate reductase
MMVRVLSQSLLLVWCKAGLYEGAHEQRVQQHFPAAAAAAAAGGTVIYAACFASQTPAHDMDAVFKAMGLMWSHGSYYRWA